MSTREEILEASYALRDEAWAAWGELSPDVVTTLLPRQNGWPSTREAYRVACRDGLTLLASDGLADLFDDEDEPISHGFGLEFYAISDEPVDKIAGSWLYALVSQMADFAASHGGIGDLLDDIEHLSSELPIDVPEEHQERFVNDAGRVGILLGVGTDAIPKRIEGPAGPIRLINVKVLTLEELDFVYEGKDAARQELVKRFEARDDGQVSSFTRASAV